MAVTYGIPCSRLLASTHQTVKLEHIKLAGSQSLRAENASKMQKSSFVPCRGNSEVVPVLANRPAPTICLRRTAQLLPVQYSVRRL
jgi:hypothetical protein